MSKLEEIAYELKNLWGYLTRKELSDYYGVSERTLFTYSKKLELPKKIDKNVVEKTGKPVDLWIHKDNKYVRQTFKNWEHFTKWEKAQSRSIKIGTLEKDGKSYVTCDFLNKKPEAVKYEQSLCI